MQADGLQEPVIGKNPVIEETSPHSITLKSIFISFSDLRVDTQSCLFPSAFQTYVLIFVILAPFCKEYKISVLMLWRVFTGVYPTFFKFTTQQPDMKTPRKSRKPRFRSMSNEKNWNLNL